MIAFPIGIFSFVMAKIRVALVFACAEVSCVILVSFVSHGPPDDVGKGNYSALRWSAMCCVNVIVSRQEKILFESDSLLIWVDLGQNTHFCVCRVFTPY